MSCVVITRCDACKDKRSERGDYWNIVIDRWNILHYSMIIAASWFSGFGQIPRFLLQNTQKCLRAFKNLRQRGEV